MKRSSRMWLLLVLLAAGRVAAQEPAKLPPAEYSCLVCHGDEELWEDEDVRFHVTADELAPDIHWQRGLRCHDCHGGDPKVEDYAGAHDKEAGFRKLESPAEIPELCGHCHSSLGFMRKYQPSARTDQEAEYWTSGHGQALRKDPKAPVATCVSCHGHHGIRAVKDLKSPVYPTRVAETCATCHSDADKMAPFMYHGRPLGHGQHELWRQSVHGRALLEKGDLSAPTCNDCHGNHGALPPDVESVASACGTCHGRISELFNGTRMMHRFQEVGLPGCATCHRYHDITQPVDEMLGMREGAVCNRCHENQEFGATLAGGDSARAMRTALEDLKRRILEADTLVEKAERLGMEVRQPRYELKDAQAALTRARTLVHSFALDPMMRAINEGSAVAARVRRQAEEALEQHSARRVWLGFSLLLVALLVGLLLAYIRRFPAPAS